jgi:CheY-like chemotaxis protein
MTTAPTTTPLLLWVDDEPELLCSHEELVCLDLGWRLAWARSIEEAAGLLARESFDIVLFDQMMPLSRPEEYGDAPIVVTAGLLLLSWLRTGRIDERLAGAADLRTAGILPDHAIVRRLANHTAPTLMVTGYQPPDTPMDLRSLLSASPFLKPIDEDRLEEVLRSLAADPRSAAS